MIDSPDTAGTAANSCSADLRQDLLAFAARDADSRLDLLGMERAALEAALAGLGLPRFRSSQIWHWLYHRGATDFADMTTLAKPLRAQLAEVFRISRPSVVTRQDSSDGTIKWLLRFADGNEAETVLVQATSPLVPKPTLARL